MKTIEELQGMTQTDLVTYIQELQEQVENLGKELDGLRSCLSHQMKMVQAMKDMIAAVDTNFDLL